MANYTDTKVKTLTINRMTKSQYDAAALGSNEFAVTPDTPATTTELGPVIVDGETIDVTATGKISVKEDVFMKNIQPIGVSFGTTSSTGTRLGAAEGKTYTAATDVKAEVDGLAGRPEYENERGLYETNSLGVPVKVATYGTSRFDRLNSDDEYTGDDFTKFFLSYGKIDISSSGMTFMTSPRRLTGYDPLDMFVVNGKVYDSVCIGTYECCDNGTQNGVRSFRGRNILVAKTNAQYQQWCRAKGWIEMTNGAWASLAMLSAIKLGCLDIQKICGQGFSNAWKGTKVSVAQTDANSVIIATANAALFNTYRSIYVGGRNRKITAVETYDDTNTRIVIEDTITTTVDQTVYAGSALSGTADNVLGQFGENTAMGASGRRSSRAMGLENFYANTWTKLSDICVLNNKYHFYPDALAAHDWPTATDLKDWEEGPDCVQTSGYPLTYYTAEQTQYYKKLLVSALGGTASAPTGDYFWGNANTPAKEVGVNGGFNSGGSYGLFACSANGAVADAGLDHSARAMFYPEK